MRALRRDHAVQLREQRTRFHRKRRAAARAFVRRRIACGAVDRESTLGAGEIWHLALPAHERLEVAPPACVEHLDDRISEDAPVVVQQLVCDARRVAEVFDLADAGHEGVRRAAQPELAWRGGYVVDAWHGSPQLEVKVPRCCRLDSRPSPVWVRELRGYHSWPRHCPTGDRNG